MNKLKLVKFCNMAFWAVVIFSLPILIFGDNEKVSSIVGSTVLFISYLIELTRAELYKSLYEEKIERWCSTCGKELTECSTCKEWWESKAQDPLINKVD